MKRTFGIFLSLLASALFFSCATVDPMKDLPQTEYEQAQRYRQRIGALDFAQYAPDEFAAGEAAFQAGEEKYKKENLVAKASFDEANKQYKTVMRKGIAARMKMSEDEIEPVRKQADDIKANVAAAAEYKEAKDAHERAVALANDENWEEAEPALTMAKQKYEAAYQSARAKKEKADAQFEVTNQELEALKGGAGVDDDAPDAPEEEMLPEEDMPDGDVFDEEYPEDEMPPADEPLPDDTGTDEESGDL